uniref:Uncharacterized protein n=1 Tax=Arundo donax TaxID=35708 RepID=A0A0A9CG20_ARUDO
MPSIARPFLDGIMGTSVICILRKIYEVFPKFKWRY